MKLGNKKIISILLIVLVLGSLVVYLTLFKTCNVTFTLKIGPGIETQQVKKGNLVSEPKVEDTDGYHFVGWYLDGEEYDFSKPVTKDINLEARWEKIN